MLEREEKYIHDWETKRGKGKWSYLIMTSLVWGTLLPVIIYSFRLAIVGNFSFSNIGSIIFNTSFFPLWLRYVGGFFIFAFIMWHLSKKKYEELKLKQQKENEPHVQH